MADAAVEYIIRNLQQLLFHQAHLIAHARSDVEKLEKHLQFFRAFLKDTNKKWRKSDSMQKLIRDIRDVVYEAEDIVDAFVIVAAESSYGTYFRRAFKKPVKLLTIAKKVEAVVDKIKVIKTDINFAKFSIDVGDEGPAGPEAPSVKQVNVVGFNHEAEEIIGYLLEETQYFDVISITGMPGLGKTTLAAKIFCDHAIRSAFPICIWIYISQEFRKKDVFLSILKEFTKIDDNIFRKSDQELAQLVAAHLEKKRYLIVMDDVWTREDWSKLKIAFPVSNKDGKVLITSRHDEVAQFANLRRTPHHMRLLTQDESWMLLQYEVFGALPCPPELEDLGKLIAKHCCGLPLAIVVIAGILTIKFKASDKMATEGSWTKVSERISTHLNQDPERRMEKIIGLSYDKLPHYLRYCFLYLAMFPEDFEIPVWKLLRMWIAEGFVQKMSDIGLEETAEIYLQDLIDRNLLRVDKRRSDGRVKTCRIHDMLRDFCKNEAAKEKDNFLQEVKRDTEGLIEPSDNDMANVRRLCIHSDVLNFLSTRPAGHRVRSFVSFSKKKITLEAQNTLIIPLGFKLVRVLEAKPIKFATIPDEFYRLFHLRYITLSFNLAFLPEYFSNFWNLQTLVIYTTSRTLDIKADIWNMMQLRDLKTNASATLPKTGQTSKAGEKFQTLGTISPQSCTKEALERAHNLTKLAVRGQLACLLDGRSFDNMQKLERLVSLNLQNDIYVNPASRRQLRGLPPSFKFPPNLKILTLSHTCLDWSNMSILELLENLEVLKLKDKAFMGACWEVAGRFRRLKFLHIGRTDLITWVASGYHFPRLRRLELHNCDELIEIPIGLADAPNLLALDMCYAELAVASAKKIQEAKQRMEEEQKSKVGGFKLSIFPADEE